MKYWYVTATWTGDSTAHPMQLPARYHDEPNGVLYFSGETALFTSYSKAKSAIARTKRHTPHRNPLIVYHIHRGRVAK